MASETSFRSVELFLLFAFVALVLAILLGL
jgi:hypothetical protein